MVLEDAGGPQFLSKERSFLDSESMLCYFLGKAIVSIVDSKQALQNM